MPHQLPAGGLIPLSYQYALLMDEDRCMRFKRAIEQLVPEGGVVLEAGGGTGILSFFAAQKARKVYTVERDPEVFAACRTFVRNNGMEHKIEVVNANAAEFVPPEPVDAVICEMMHVALVNEQQVPVMNAVRESLTRAYPDHPFVCIPGSALNYVQLIHENQNFLGYETRLVRYWPAANVDPRALPMSTLIPYWEADFNTVVDVHVDQTLSVVATEDGVVNAMRLLTQAELFLDQQSMDPASLIDWFLMWLIVPIEPVEVKAGETLMVRIRYTAGCGLEGVSLEARVLAAQGAAAA